MYTKVRSANPQLVLGLHREVKHGGVVTGTRSKDYEDALLWLEDAGMIYRVYDITKPGMPLSAKRNNNGNSLSEYNKKYYPSQICKLISYLCCNSETRW